MAGKYNYSVFHNSVIIITFVITLQIVHTKSFSRFKPNEPFILTTWEGDKFRVEAPVIPDACKQSGLCRYVDNYPKELVGMIMNKLGKKKITKFNIDRLYANQYLEEMEDLCATKKEEIFYPQAAKDHNNEWQFVLNIPGRYFQGYRIHECLDAPEPSCSKAAYIVNSEDFSWACVQKYTNREMVYLNLKNNTVTTNYFQVPSCCSCNLQLN